MPLRPSSHGIVNRGIVILSVIGVLLVCGAYFFLRTAGLDEKDRVHHTSGFSIIHPPQWELDHFTTATEAGGANGMRFSPIKFIGKSPSMVVERLPYLPEDKWLIGEEYKQEPFDGAPAWQRVRGSRRGVGVDIYVEKSDSWIHFVVHLPGLEGTRAEDYLQYLRSVKIEGPLKVLPASSTRPIQQPTTMTFGP